MESRTIIFHIDVNSAFLSWSAAYRTEVLGEKMDLRTVPSIVGGDQEARRGIVLAKSTPAKKYGIQTGEPIVAARKKCPNLIIIPPDFPVYVEKSKALIALLKRYSDQVVQYSIDEAWADFTGYEMLYGDPVVFAHKLKDIIKEELKFTVNIGVSSNRLLAKMAGDFKKPDLVHTLFPEEIEEKMWPLPVERLFLVGKAAADKLHSLGIYTIGDLARTDVNTLKAHMKKHGEVIWNYAWGREEENPMEEKPSMEKKLSMEETPEAREGNKVYGNSMTTPVNVTDVEYARQILLSLSETVGMRLRADQAKISCVSITLRSSDFINRNRQMQLSSATDVTEEIYAAACRLYDELWDGRPLRLIGVSTSRVSYEEYRQYNLFDQGIYDKLEKCDKAIDSIRARFGEDSVMRASFLNSRISHTGGGLNKEKRAEAVSGPEREKRRTAKER